jgi:hypothetical protein
MNVNCGNCPYTGGCTYTCAHLRPVLPPQPQFWPATPPKGCICPPGSEQTCLRHDCGRKDPLVGTATKMTVI